MKVNQAAAAALAAMIALAAGAAWASCPPNQKCQSNPPSRPAAPSRPAPPAYRQTPPSGRPAGAPQTLQRAPGASGYVRPQTNTGGRAYPNGGAAGGRQFAPGQGYGQRGQGAVSGQGRYGVSRGFTRPMHDTSGRRFMFRGRSYSAFRAQRYRWPRGYGYRRFYAHQFFPRAFWTPDYYIDDWADYGVYAPPYDTQWIRYGTDLVLVNLDTGEILDVVPGVFVDADNGDQGPPPGYDDQGPPPGSYGQGPPIGYDQGPPPDDQGPPPSPY